MLLKKAFCLSMEATGAYGYALAEHVYNLGYVVYVMNPALIKYYGKSLHHRTKTDKQDAKLIHSFMLANQVRLHIWKPLSQDHKDLRALTRCLTNLKEEVVKFSNMAGSELSSKSRKVYQSMLENLEEEAASIVLEIGNIMSNNPELERLVSLLLTIPGIGEITAWNLLSELSNLKGFTPKLLAAYAGLNPAIRQSGTSVHGLGSISKLGSARLRSSLYLPAMVALRYNPCVKSLGDRLKVKGKKGKVIIVAAMHKLLRMVFAIFNPAINKG